MYIRENLSDMNKENTSENFKQIFEGKEYSKKITPLAKANEAYNRLLDKGVIKKRGYTLRGIEDAHLFRFRFNDR